MSEKTIVTITISVDFPGDDCRKLTSFSSGWICDLYGLAYLEFGREANVLAIYVRDRASDRRRFAKP